MTDLPARPALEPAPRPGSQDELRALAAPRRLGADDHMFTAPGLSGTLRLQLFTASGARRVAAATQVVDKEGVGLMNGVESFTGAAGEMRCPDQDLPPVWSGSWSWTAHFQETRFQLLMFGGADCYRPHEPRWSVITHERLQDLVARPRGGLALIE